jgi:hypothetical protein
MCKEGCKGVCTSVSFKNKCSSWQELLAENKLALQNLKELILIDDANDEIANTLINERRTALLAELKKDMEELKHKLSDEDDPYQFGIIPQQVALKEKLESVSKELKSILKPIR